MLTYTLPLQPPKRKASASAASSSATAADKDKAPRPSKLARENNISAQEEAEIREAFGLFAEPMDGEKDGVLPIGDLRRALIALGIPPASRAELSEFVGILDPDDEGFAVYPSFVAICALQMRARADRTSRAEQAQEVDEAFNLFVGHGQSAAASAATTGDIITVAHLRRIAATLKEDVADDVLRDMVLEANGGAGVTAGVDRDAFENVMRRAGVWR
ncbi:hypothetical protein HMPREF1624_07858 [Sporothrix schenckii ATCC 58251]|uniref:EF-hand domain-containing protein n=2 Tax=Sporothrix schenckii TaxID=29908 RepID=U7PJG0_SPOS1|nr:hypothetical protein HMPREF1624_07858 [Sporothrix schenckii ATCC 58251]